MGLFGIGRKTDRNTFQAFYEATVQPLARHLQALGLRDQQELEDVLQNSYLEAHKSFVTIKDQKAALAWIMTIGRRQYGRYVEQKVRQRTLFLEGSFDQEQAIGAAPDRRIVPSDERLIAEGLCRQILNLISRIENPKRQLAIQLFFLEDRSLKEIASATDTNVSTLTTWISRFRSEVQSETEEEGLIATPEVCP